MSFHILGGFQVDY
uniref:Uncharacterized protein n=1 Tax=Rhizophora mucronata TaxID=61149 RepID=A0A2P2QYZ1_RHIMU